jgi:hypothetical protein
MGAAQEHRGNMVIRRQADDQVARVAPSVENRHLREVVKERDAEVSLLKSDLQRARRLISLLRAEKAALQERNKTLLGAVDRIEESMRGVHIARKAMNAVIEIQKIKSGE